MYKQILINAKSKTGEVKKLSRLGEVHGGGESPYWTVVPSKEEEEEEEKTKKKNEEEEKKEKKKKEKEDEGRGEVKCGEGGEE